MVTKVYLTEEFGGTRIKELKDQLFNLVSNNEGITNVEILEKATEAGVNPDVGQEFVDALLAELSNAGKVKLYV